MPQIYQPTKITNSSKILLSILEELKLLREEVGLLLPQEDVEEYAHSERIKRSYKSAIGKYVPDKQWR